MGNLLLNVNNGFNFKGTRATTKPINIVGKGLESLSTTSPLKQQTGLEDEHQRYVQERDEQAQFSEEAQNFQCIQQDAGALHVCGRECHLPCCGQLGEQYQCQRCQQDQ